MVGDGQPMVSGPAVPGAGTPAPAPAEALAPTWPPVAVVNTPSSGVSDIDARAYTEAIAHQVLYDFGPRWHAGAHFTFVPTGHKIPALAWVVALLGTSDEAGALGYHDLTPQGLPLGKVFAATDRQYGENICVTLSHEVLEMLADPWIDLAAEADSGKFYAWEACDAVEADGLGYSVNGQQVSAFVTPSWFGHGPGPVCYPPGRVLRPFELAPGGYISVLDPGAGAGWTQVTARQPSPAERYDGSGRLLEEPIPFGALDPTAIPRVGSRRERRFRGRDQWLVSTFAIG